MEQEPIVKKVSAEEERARKTIPMHFGPYLYLGGQLLVAVGLSCGALP